MLFLTHAFHVGFDRLDDLFPVLSDNNNVSVEHSNTVRFDFRYLCRTTGDEFANKPRTISCMYHFSKNVLAPKSPC